MMNARTIEALYQRLQRARELVEAGKVSPVHGLEGVYVVLNGDGTAHYLVNADSSCTCPDFEKHGGRIPCKHLLAVNLYQQKAQTAGAASAPEPTPARNRRARRQEPQEQEEWLPLPSGEVHYEPLMAPE
ncbi:MAG: SWIM zinc finger domain-containing protein [Fimbriimonadales bacterium]|nr:SWIM zinc finger domain-containing protein [Fimbriimonadales bacterium]